MRKKKVLMLGGWGGGFCKVESCCDDADEYDKLVFGSGTKLIIQPNLNASEPSIYPLRSPNETLSAYLVTDFFPDDISVTTSRGYSEKTNGSVVQVTDVETGKTDASYGMVLWGLRGSFSLISVDEKNISLPEDSAEKDETCMALALADDFVTDEKLNFLSFTMMGLRIIFVKGVAVNLLLTICLWKS